MFYLMYNIVDLRLFYYEYIENKFFYFFYVLIVWLSFCKIVDC